MTHPLTDRVAIVTGASRGIGKAIALTLAEAGAHIVAVATNSHLLEEVCKFLRTRGVRAEERIADVSSPMDAERVVEGTLSSFGRIDILVNNAGITKDGLLLRMKEEDWKHVLDVNLTGTFHFAKAVARPMIKAKWGRIVNITSVVGLMGNVGQANYAASKGGVIALTKSLARELASRHVTVNAVAPGYITTDMTATLDEGARTHLLAQIPLGRLGKPEDVASAVAFLCSDAAEYVTGQVLSVDGGMYM